MHPLLHPTELAGRDIRAIGVEVALPPGWERQLVGWRECALVQPARVLVHLLYALLLLALALVVLNLAVLLHGPVVTSSIDAGTGLRFHQRTHRLNVLKLW